MPELIARGLLLEVGLRRVGLVHRLARGVDEPGRVPALLLHRAEDILGDLDGRVGVLVAHVAPGDRDDGILIQVVEHLDLLARPLDRRIGLGRAPGAGDMPEEGARGDGGQHRRQGDRAGRNGPPRVLHAHRHESNPPCRRGPHHGPDAMGDAPVTP
ncbi:MAG TPA: hypothetical protein VG406_24160 [Isosphaeraceae bacterium]|nr:hypothetical protein [Isosphaeraceae bacterium]